MTVMELLLVMTMLIIYILIKNNSIWTKIVARFIIKAWPFEPPTVIQSHLTEKDRTLR